MSKQSLASASGRIFVSVLLLISTCCSLKCRTDDGPSESELKRITRSCMRKIGEKLYSYNGGSTGFSNNNNKHYGPLHQSNFGTQYKSNSRYDYNYDYDDDDNYNGNNNNNYNNNNYNNNGNYDRDHGNRNVLQHRERQQNNQNNRADNNNNRSASSSSSSTGNNNGGRYENGNSNGNGHANAGGGGNGGGGDGNGGGSGNSKNGGRNSGNSGGGGGNIQRGQSQNNSNKNNNNNNNNNNHGSSNDTADAACVVHCFFEEMNMLNSDDYPDRYKVQYGLTRELRDRELRNFYTDTIQDCFHYLESQRRRDKCHYSRDLIHCMSEYAKVNCDDWQEFSVVFN